MKYKNINDIVDPYEKIEATIAKMMLSDNFWGYMFGRIGKVCTEGINSIMGVGHNKRNGAISLYFHPELVKNTDEKNLRLILEHEGCHLVNLHIPRLLRLLSNCVDEKEIGVKQQVWNIATDCCVNLQMGIPDHIVVGGEKWPSQKPKMYGLPDDRSSDSYFKTLMNQDNNEQCVICGGNKEDDNENESNNGNSEEENESNKNDDNSNDGGTVTDSNDDKSNNSTNSNDGGNGEDKEKSKCPLCGREIKNNRNIDDHSNWSTDKGNQSEEFAKKIEEKTKELVRKTLKSYDYKNKRGALPGYLSELIDDLLDVPKIPYYELIRSYVKGTRLSKWKKSYTRVNKKRVYTFFDEDLNYKPPIISPFPGKVRDFSFNIVIMIDTSMSQSPDDIKEALSGIKNIIENDRHCKTTVIEIDTKIGKEYEVKKIDDIDFNISGRGGTILKDGVIRAKELNPDVMLGFTDGFCDNINELPSDIIPRKIIWCISKGGTDENLNKTGPSVFVERD